jgi:hypothetical protein
MSSTFEGSDMNSESIGHEENMYLTKGWVSLLNLPIDKVKKINNGTILQQYVIV